MSEEFNKFKAIVMDWLQQPDTADDVSMADLDQRLKKHYALTFFKPTEKGEIKIGDTILVEQAWEDESGAYHDEYAEVVGINGDLMQLMFNDPKIDEFLKSAEYRIEDYKPEPRP